MIQSVLFFALGFLSALLLALLVLPAVWRRAVRLTRRGIEASMPLTLEEIQANKDQLRAQHAMTARRLEIERDAAAHKSNELTVSVSRMRRKADRLSQDRATLQETLKAAEARGVELEAELRSRDALVAQFAERTREAEDVLAARIQELSELGNLYEEASLASTARQVEVLARETEIDRLRQQMTKLRRERKKVLETVEDSSSPQPSDPARGAGPTAKKAQVSADLADLNAQLLASGVGGPDDERLRGKMHQLAADVVNMVAQQPANAAAIKTALAAPHAANPQSRIGSLAERIRRDAASDS